MTKKRAEKIRFIFGRDMTPEEMVDAVVRMAKEYDIPFKDDRKEHGIPIVDSRRKGRAKRKMAKECGIETRDTHKPKKKGRRKDNESKQTKG
jgi:hypothetical protein